MNKCKICNKPCGKRKTCSKECFNENASRNSTARRKTRKDSWGWGGLHIEKPDPYRGYLAEIRKSYHGE